MVTAITPIPSFDTCFGLNQTPISNDGSNNKTIAIIVLTAGVLLTAAYAYNLVRENKRLNQMISDMESKQFAEM